MPIVYSTMRLGEVVEEHPSLIFFSMTGMSYICVVSPQNMRSPSYLQRNPRTERAGELPGLLSD